MSYFLADPRIGLGSPGCGSGCRCRSCGCSSLDGYGEVDGLPIYGNYCGPGHGDPTGRTPPIDAVDAACRAHDLCYGSTNYFNCGCDRNLVRSLPAAIAATPGFAAKAAGAAIMAYFSNSPCVCNKRVCLPWVGCHNVPVPGRGGIGIC